MSTVVIRRVHMLSQQQVRLAANAVAAELEEEYGVRGRWEGKELRFEHASLRGTLRLGEREIVIEIIFGWLLVAFQEQIVAVVEARLDEVLATGPGGSRGAKGESR